MTDLMRSRSSSPTPLHTPLRKKTSTKSSSKGAPSMSIPTKGLTPEAKRVILERAMDMAYKNLPWTELANELGIAESRLKDQLRPYRSNLRKAVMKAFAQG